MNSGISLSPTMFNTRLHITIISLCQLGELKQREWEACHEEDYDFRTLVNLLAFALSVGIVGNCLLLRVKGESYDCEFATAETNAVLLCMKSHFIDKLLKTYWIGWSEFEICTWRSKQIIYLSIDIALTLFTSFTLLLSVKYLVLQDHALLSHRARYVAEQSLEFHVCTELTCTF